MAGEESGSSIAFSAASTRRARAWTQAPSLAAVSGRSQVVNVRGQLLKSSVNVIQRLDPGSGKHERNAARYAPAFLSGPSVATLTRLVPRAQRRMFEVAVSNFGLHPWTEQVSSPRIARDLGEAHDRLTDCLRDWPQPQKAGPQS